MFKSFFLFLFLYFFCPCLMAQHGKDTLLAKDSPTITAVSPDTMVETNANRDDSLIKPVSAGEMIYADSVRYVSQKQLRSYLGNPDYAYANDSAYWKRKPVQPVSGGFSLLSIPVFRWFIILSVLAIILYGIYRLAEENSFSWFTRKQGWRTDEAGSPASGQINYDQEIRNHQMAGNYRMAVRFLYLRLIQTVREGNRIRMRQSSTNSDITRAFDNPEQSVAFRYLSTAYEYIFYGGFIPQKELFDRLKIKFDQFQQQLSH